VTLCCWMCGSWLDEEPGAMRCLPAELGVGREQSKRSCLLWCQEPASNSKAILETAVTKSHAETLGALGREHQVLCCVPCLHRAFRSSMRPLDCCAVPIAGAGRCFLPSGKLCLSPGSAHFTELFFFFFFFGNTEASSVALVCHDFSCSQVFSVILGTELNRVHCK